ncbi:hypothetical protein EDC46_0921 [Vespertiliibacter pulmonis]|uniref:Uncharacterized protein n=1 Tax=Vespertiliibacter pulmonis TaxID=1443036 RepID=A0A3N4WCG0_9PAST|nr:hypothetical protein [Vespertiliibacter pulmonis]RPE83720.1 hypothetical protein EDC46_0921 [Vespertiliibacter pulmonis]
MNYYNSETKITEEFACELLNKAGIKCKLNNLECITNVDIIAQECFKIDVQFSKNFDVYGDCRLDIISAYQKEVNKNDDTQQSYIYDKNLKFIDNFEKKHKVKVIKYGKLFQRDYLDALIIFFYKGQDINKDNSNLDKIMIIRKDDIINFLENRKAELFNRVKLNDKKRNGLSDVHGSAFIPVNAEYLAKATSCIFIKFANKENFLLNGEKIKEYLFKPKKV